MMEKYIICPSIVHIDSHFFISKLVDALPLILLYLLWEGSCLTVSSCRLSLEVKRASCTFSLWCGPTECGDVLAWLQMSQGTPVYVWPLLLHGSNVFSLSGWMGCHSNHVNKGNGGWHWHINFVQVLLHRIYSFFWCFTYVHVQAVIKMDVVLLFKHEAWACAVLF